MSLFAVEFFVTFQAKRKKSAKKASSKVEKRQKMVSLKVAFTSFMGEYVVTTLHRTYNFIQIVIPILAHVRC